MQPFTEPDLEELLAQGVWAKRNNLEVHALQDPWNEHVYRLGNDHSQSPFSVDEPRPEPIWSVLLGGALCCVVVALLLLIS